jgi:cytochrome c-type biogenesis protein CcmF
MIADLGNISLLLAFGTSIFAALAGWIGMRRNDDRWVSSARNAAIIVFPLVLLASLAIIYSLVTSDFSMDYVWQVSSRDMPTYLKVTALWGGQAGSLLFWNLLLAAFIAAAMVTKWSDQKGADALCHHRRQHEPDLFPLHLRLCGEPICPAGHHSAGRQRPEPAAAPPRHDHPPADALSGLRRLHRSLRLCHGRADVQPGLGDNWIRTTRRWTLVAWLFLSLGLILGGRWAYDVLGWGGYWGWDPVENASLMPWLAATAFLHSVMIQERCGCSRCGTCSSSC